MKHADQNKESHSCPITLPGSSSARGLHPARESSVTGESGLFTLFKMDNGFIFLHRKLRDHWIATDHSTLAVFIQILLRVEWKEEKRVFFNGCEILLRPGEMTCGRKQMSQWSNLTPQKTRTAFSKLKSTSTITIKTNNKFSILYLNNWEKYQKETNIQPTDQLSINKRSTNDQPHLNKIITKEANKYKDHFIEIWQMYPKRVGRKHAERHFLASVKDDLALSSIRQALGHYKSSKTVLEGFVKNGSTWFNEWEDWVDYQEESPDFKARMARMGVPK